MLILTRRVSETIMIGNDITVTILGVKGNQVRIGVNAPKEVAVHREEVYERIKEEERELQRCTQRGAKVCTDLNCPTHGHGHNGHDHRGGNR